MAPVLDKGFEDGAAQLYLIRAIGCCRRIRRDEALANKPTDRRSRFKGMRCVCSLSSFLQRSIFGAVLEKSPAGDGQIRYTAAFQSRNGG